jgi:hypothetical protein
MPQATAALTALCAVLAGDPSGAAAEALYRCALPSRLLGELREATGRALSLVGVRAVPAVPAVPAGRAA